MRLKKLNENAGGKPMYDENMIKVTFFARTDQIAWLRDRPQGISRTLRALIDKAMAEESVTIPVDAS